MQSEKLKNTTRLTVYCSTCGKPVSKGDGHALGNLISAASCCRCQESSDTADSTTTETEEPTQVQSPVPDLGENYEVKELIGEGGMGRVYKVIDRETGNTFAAKILRAELARDPNNVKRFMQIAEMISSLDHHNFVAVYNTGTTSDGIPFLLMDYIEGESLSEILKREGRLEGARALDLSRQLLEAIAFAHANDIVHRDIKPANVMVSKIKSDDPEARGDSDVVRVLDFGIANVLPSQSINRETFEMTQTGEIFGSPDYMSPEQCLGYRPDNRSDIYAFGCLLYECLTGQPPFHSQSPIHTIVRHLNQDPPGLPSELIKDPLTRNLENIVHKCLEKDAINRYQSATEVLKDLEAIKGGKNLVQHRHEKPSTAKTNAALILSFAFAFGLTAAYYVLFRDLFNINLADFQPLVSGIKLTLEAGTALFAFLLFRAWRRIKTGVAWQSDWWFFFQMLCLLIACASGTVVAIATNDLYAEHSIAAQYFYAACLYTHLLALAVSYGTIFGALVPGSGLKLKASQAAQRLFIAGLVSITIFAVVPKDPAVNTDMVEGFPNRLARLMSFGSFNWPAPAADLLRVIVFFDKTNYDALIETAESYTVTSRPQQAVALLSPLLDSADTKRLSAIQLENALMARSRSYMETKQHSEALADVNRILKVAPKSWSALQQRGFIYEMYGKNEEALADYKSATKVDPGHTVRQDHARLCLVLGRNAEAVADYSFLVESTAFQYCSDYTRRGVAYELSGEMDKALADYKTALKLSERADVEKAFLLKRLNMKEQYEALLAMLGLKGAPIDELKKSLYYSRTAPKSLTW